MSTTQHQHSLHFMVCYEVNWCVITSSIYILWHLMSTRNDQFHLVDWMKSTRNVRKKQQNRIRLRIVANHLFIFHAVVVRCNRVQCICWIVCDMGETGQMETGTVRASEREREEFLILFSWFEIKMNFILIVADWMESGTINHSHLMLQWGNISVLRLFLLLIKKIWCLVSGAMFFWFVLLTQFYE